MHLPEYWETEQLLWLSTMTVSGIHVYSYAVSADICTDVFLGGNTESRRGRLNIELDACGSKNRNSFIRKRQRQQLLAVRLSGEPFVCREAAYIDSKS